MLPSSAFVFTSHSSDSSPTSLRSDSSRSKRRTASSVRPMSASACTIQNEHSRNDPSPWGSPSTSSFAWYRSMRPSVVNSRSMASTVATTRGSLVGRQPTHAPRVGATVDAIERELTTDGLIDRYHAKEDVDGLPQGEGSFLLCSFWMVQALALMGRTDDAVRRFERLLSLRNDVGLLSEECDVKTKALLGNIPQAFSHTALVNAALVLSGSERIRSYAPDGRGAVADE